MFSNYNRPMKGSTEALHENLLSLGSYNLCGSMFKHGSMNYRSRRPAGHRVEKDDKLGLRHS